MKTTRSPKGTIQIEDMLAPYEIHWHKWIKSDMCFLNSEERRFLEAYWQCRNFETAASRVRKTTEGQQKLVRNTLNKMKSNKKRFNQWILKSTDLFSPG